jgi:anti-sigma factor RsiW
MTRGCSVPIADTVLLDYWAADLPEADSDRVEAHLFDCQDCAARLESLASVGAGLVALVRRGRVSGVISHGLLNRMQRDGVRVRLYSLWPGDTVACAAFPDDDIVVASLRADVSGAEPVRLQVKGPGDVVLGDSDSGLTARSTGEVLWATPGATVRQMPSMSLRLTLTSGTGDDRRVLGEYVLDHSA